MVAVISRPDGTWPRRRLPRYGFDAVLAVGATAVVLTVEFAVPVGASPRASLLAAVLLPAQTLPLVARRRAPVLVMIVVLAAGVGYTAAGLGPPMAEFVVLIGVYTVAAHRDSRTAVGCGVAAAAVAQVVTLTGVASWRYLLGQVVLIGSATVLGLYVRTRRAYVGDLIAWAAHLEHERERADRQAVIQERTRIAREMHDIIGHHVTFMVLQAGAISQILDPAQQRAREGLETVAASGRQALAEMRRMLGMLRLDDSTRGGDDGDDEQPLEPRPGLDDIAALVDTYRRAGLPVDLDMQPAPWPLPSSVGLSAYRIVQEALTNVWKHARATRSCVAIRYRADGMEVEVVDDGHGYDAQLADRGGHGLIGMHERVAMFGGTLSTQQRPEGGYRVLARLPLGQERA